MGALPDAPGSGGDPRDAVELLLGELRARPDGLSSREAEAIAERFVRTARSECLDWLLILNRRHLERVLHTYIDHYNTQRPRRALELRLPKPDIDARSGATGIYRHDRLGGLIHEYYQAAA